VSSNIGTKLKTNVNSQKNFLTKLTIHYNMFRPTYGSCSNTEQYTEYLGGLLH
jgi:hypothetical protein